LPIARASLRAPLNFVLGGRIYTHAKVKHEEQAVGVLDEPGIMQETKTLQALDDK